MNEDAVVEISDSEPESDPENNVEAQQDIETDFSDPENDVEAARAEQDIENDFVNHSEGKLGDSINVQKLY